MPEQSKRGRTRNSEATTKVTPAMSADAIRCLKLLSKSGRYGSTVNEVARYLLIRSIDDLTRTGVLPAIPLD
jgi:hypothetical protein